MFFHCVSELGPWQWNCQTVLPTWQPHLLQLLFSPVQYYSPLHLGKEDRTPCSSVLETKLWGALFFILRWKNKKRGQQRWSSGNGQQMRACSFTVKGGLPSSQATCRNLSFYTAYALSQSNDLSFRKDYVSVRLGELKAHSNSKDFVWLYLVALQNSYSITFSVLFNSRVATWYN